MSKRYDVIRINPEAKPIYLVVEAFDGDPEVTSYYYEEGTCPVNVLNGRFEKVIVDGDTDPHGLFEYVRTIDTPAFLGRTHDPDKEWKTIIPEAFDGEEST